MELCTRGMNPWGERVVHILVYSCEGIPEDINDKETYKIFTLDTFLTIYIIYSIFKKIFFRIKHQFIFTNIFRIWYIT